MIDKIGKVHVLQTLGSGAHSSILHVRRDADSREYALKLVNIDGKDDLKYLEQAKHEYRVGQMLSHPNLVKVYCLEVESGWFSGPKKARLLIEYVPGKTMDTLPLQRMAKLLRIFERIAKAPAGGPGGVTELPAAQQRIVNAVSQACTKCHDAENDPHFELAKYWPKVVHGPRLAFNLRAPPGRTSPPPRRPAGRARPAPGSSARAACSRCSRGTARSARPARAGPSG